MLTDPALVALLVDFSAEFTQLNDALGGYLLPNCYQDDREAVNLYMHRLEVRNG